MSEKGGGGSLTITETSVIHTVTLIDKTWTFGTEPHNRFNLQRGNTESSVSVNIIHFCSDNLMFFF